jgi:hypothetical protein
MSGTGATRPARRKNQRSMREVLAEEWHALFKQWPDLPSRDAPVPDKDQLAELRGEMAALLNRERDRLRAIGGRPRDEAPGEDFVLTEEEIAALETETSALQPRNRVIPDAIPPSPPWWRRLLSPSTWISMGPLRIDDDPEVPGPPDNKDPAMAINEAEAHALCLSGGGIRSAAFCMGVLQALARRRALTHFHYLSTVSGGGYIGAWLTTLIQRLGGSVLLAQFILAVIPTSGRVRNVREFTNFLAPSPGYVSADARTAGLLVVRNILLNWLLFFPVLLALALVPVAVNDAVAMGQYVAGWFAGAPMALLLATAALTLFFAALFTILALPSHDRPPFPELGRAQGWDGLDVLLGIALPVVLWAFLLTEWFACARASCSFAVVAALVAVVDVAAMLAAYLVAWAIIARRAARAGDEIREQLRLQRMFLMWNIWLWLLACGVDAALLVLGMWLAWYQPDPVLTAFAPTGIIGAHTAQSAFYVGMRRYAVQPDLDREWLGRLNADTLGIVIVWSIFAGLVLYSQPLIDAIGLQAGLLGAGGAGSFAAILGFSARTLFLHQTPSEAKGFRIRWDMVMLAATVVFVVLLFALLGVLAQHVTLIALGVLEQWPAGEGFSPWQWIASLWQLLGSCILSAGANYAWELAYPMPGKAFIMALALAALLALIALRLGRRVNVNRFSLQANRLNVTRSVG